MAIRTILHYPDKRLREPGLPVTDFGPALQALVDDMAETMYAAPGVGLAATQIGEAKRLFLVDVATGDDEPSDLRVFVNPEILESRGEEEMDEGCLSVPGFYETVRRADWVRVRALDRHGQPFELETDGLLAVCIQHELDHLDGKLFVDYLSSLKRDRIRRKLEKEARTATTR